MNTHDPMAEAITARLNALPLDIRKIVLGSLPIGEEIIVALGRDRDELVLGLARHSETEFSVIPTTLAEAMEGGGVVAFLPESPATLNETTA